MSSRYAAKLHQLEEKGRLRTLRPLQQLGHCRVQYEGEQLLNLGSNDYLGLGQDMALRQEFYTEMDGGRNAASSFAAASSRLLTGDFPATHALEQELAMAYGSEAALFFNSGYHANIGILPTLFGKGDLILSDKLNHASIHDALTLCRADHKRFRHGDYEQLRQLLAKYREQYEEVVIVSESLFSMDGDVADIEQLVALKEEFSAKIYLDEAHALGVYGTLGLGKAEESEQIHNIDFLVGTFGKAMASIGAFVCCSREVYEYLVNHSRSFIFTTGLPPVTISWNRFIFQQMQAMESKRRHLQHLSHTFRESLGKKGIATRGSTNIVPVLIGEDSMALEGAVKMQELGYLVLPIRPPSVPEGTARFRFSLCANMDWHDLQGIAMALASQVKGTLP
jgi:8-amino-7-oxononanoate synthase